MGKSYVLCVMLFIVAFLLSQNNETFATNDENDEKKCVVVTNELNTGSLSAVKNNDFIELKRICGNQGKIESLQGYKVIGITVGVGANNKQEMTIDMVVNLWNEKFKSDFYTIRSKNADMDTASPYVSYKNKYTGGTKSVASFFTKNNNNLYVIAIVHKKKFTFPQLVLNKKKPYLSVNSEILELIKSNLVDMIVYGQKAPFEKCDVFSNLCNDYGNKEYVLREFDNTVKGIDRSLNRCALCQKNLKLVRLHQAERMTVLVQTFFLNIL